MIIVNIGEGIDNYNEVNALRKRFKNATRHKYVVCGVNDSRHKDLLNRTFEVELKKLARVIKEVDKISICMDGTVVIRHMSAYVVGQLVAVKAATYDIINSIVIDMIDYTLEVSLKRI